MVCEGGADNVRHPVYPTNIIIFCDTRIVFFFKVNVNIIFYIQYLCKKIYEVDRYAFH